MKKLLVSLLCVVMMVTFMPSMAFADAADSVADVSTREELKNALDNNAITVINILNDIDMGSDEWYGVEIKSGRELMINGNGNTISNLKVYKAYMGPNGSGIPGDGGSSDYYTGWIANNKGVLTVNDLSFSNAEIDANPVTVEKQSTGSSILAVVCANNMGTVELNNVNVDSSTVKGYSKVGILHGFTQGGSFTANHCTVTNNTVIVEADGTDPEAGFSGILIGYDGNGLAKTNGIKMSGNQSIIDESVNWGQEPVYDAETGVTSIAGWGITCETYTKGSAGTQAVQFEASVDGYQFETLEEAITAADNEDTVTLLKNINGNIVIPETANIVLDLNGHILSGGTVPQNAALTNNGTVVIKDSTGAGGTIKREDNGDKGYYTIDNQGTMTIESGRVENKTGSMPDGSSLIRNAGKGKEAVLNIKGGEIYQDGFIAVKNDDYGILNVTGGKISTSGDTSTNTASAIQNWSKAEITGGEINGTVWTGTWSNDLPASNTTIGGDVIVNGQVTVKPHEEGLTKVPSLEINGGTLNVSKWDVADNASDVSINAGKLNYGDGSVLNYVSDDAGKNVTVVLSEDTVITNSNADKVVFEAPAGIEVENKTDASVTVTTPNGTIELKPGEKEETKPYEPPYIPPVTPVQKPVIEAEEGATVALSKDGTTATIVIDKDATLKDVLLNGESLGAVTEVQNLKTGDKLVVIVETLAEKNARLKAGVENTTIKLKSALGKGHVRLDWNKSEGYKVDNYQVFRSTKRYSGYGTKAYFTTKQGGLKAWYKNTKELKKGTRYYYKVRGVREIAGETVYTQWSNKAWRLVK